MSAKLLSQVMGPEDAKETNYWKGILKYGGGAEPLEKWDKSVTARLKHDGGQPWIDVWENKFEPLSEDNAKATAIEISLARIDPTNANKAFAPLPAEFLTLASQRVVRKKIFESIYFIARSTTKGEAQEIIEGMPDSDAHKIRARMFSLWGEKETADKQELQKLFQAGISNDDKITKFTEKDDVKLHVEKLTHLQQRLRDMTEPGDRNVDSTLGTSALMQVFRTSLPPIYTPTLAAYDSNQDFRREIMGYINILLGELRKPTIPLETEHLKFERLKKMVFNQYEAIHRSWLAKAEEEKARDEQEMNSRTPAYFVSPSANKSWSNQPCFQFQKGNCSFGDKCRYSHDADMNLGAQQNRLPFSEQTCTDCGQKGHQRGYYSCPKFQGKKDSSTVMAATGKRKRNKQQPETMDDKTKLDTQEELFNFVTKSYEACQ
jgi:hypothetical protein